MFCQPGGLSHWPVWQSHIFTTVVEVLKQCVIMTSVIPCLSIFHETDSVVFVFVFDWDVLTTIGWLQWTLVMITPVNVTWSLWVNDYYGRFLKCFFSSHLSDICMFEHEYNDEWNGHLCHVLNIIDCFDIEFSFFALTNEYKNCNIKFVNQQIDLKTHYSTLFLAFCHNLQGDI